MAWSVLQSASGSTSASTVAATFATANVQAGTKIIAVVSVGATSAPAVTSVQDAASNSWTQVGNANQANGRVYIFALDTPAGDVGTKPTLTATSTGTPGLGIEILEVSGLLAGNTTAMLDGTAATLTGTASSTGSPTYSSTAVNEFLLSAYGDFGTGNTVVTAGGWTAGGSNVNTSTNSNCLLQYKNSTGGSETDGFTSADPGGWAVAEVAFQLAAAPAGVAAALPGRTWLRRFHHRQQLPPAPAAVTAPQAGPPVYPPGHPVQAKGTPQPGGRVSRRAGTYASPGPAVRPPAGPVRAQPAVPQLTGRTRGRAGMFAGLGPAVKALATAVTARVRVLPPRGRTASRAGTYAGTGPPVTPPHGPARTRITPPPAGRTASRTGTFTQVVTGSGPPVYPLGHPVQARRLPQRGGSASGRSGTWTLVVTGSGPPVYPLGHPVQARRLPARGGSTAARRGPYGGLGPPVTPQKQPAGTARQQPPPPARGRTAAQRGPYAGTGAPVIRLRRPARGQPAKPVLTGRVASRAGVAVFIPPPPFTVGVLTAADKASGVLTAAGASSALTAATTAASTLTAGDQRTGGPG